jgi:hypothetical protein
LSDQNSIRSHRLTVRVHACSYKSGRSGRERRPEVQVREFVGWATSDTLLEGTHRCGNRPVQPSTSLTNQLRSLFRDVRLGLARFDVTERPPFASLGRQLEAQDPIFGQEHVLLEDPHPVDPIRTEPVCKTVVATEVFLQWLALDRLEPVSAEGARQDCGKRCRAQPSFFLFSIPTSNTHPKRNRKCSPKACPGCLTSVSFW